MQKLLSVTPARAILYGLCLTLCSCGGSADTPTREAESITDRPIGTTNIRMAEARDGQWVEVAEVTRDPDHLGQEIPFVYQMEGPGWENENVAFRLYFDERNGIDIFGKKTSDMVLDSVGTGHLGKDQNYHAMSDWGMDVLKVGNSLGAGSIALMVDGKVYRLDDVREERFRRLTEGPEGSSFLLEYDGWEVAGRTLSVDWTISIEPGTWGYESSVAVTGLEGGEELLTGIVNLHSDTLYTDTRGDRFLMYTHGDQAELEHTLGMALSAPAVSVLGHGTLGPEAQPVASTYYLRLKLAEGEPTSYRFSAGWEPGHPDFADREAFVAAIY